MRVPSSPFPFIFHTEFPKSTDKNILAILEGLFDGLYKGFNHLGGFGPGEAEVVANRIYDLDFGGCHKRLSCGVEYFHVFIISRVNAC
jgi:hypothetical protein